MRGLHRWVGLTSALFGIAMAVTGVILSIDPATEAATTGSLTAPPDITVAQLAQAVSDQVPGLERIEKTANHTVIAHFATAEGFGQTYFNATTLTPIDSTPNSPFLGYIKDFHRSLFLGDFGRGVVGISALAMFVLSVSGLAMIVRKMGGWRAVISPPRSGGYQTLHLNAGRIAVIGLLIVSLTGVVMSLTTFDLIPSPTAANPELPVIQAADAALSIGDLLALQSLPLTELRELVLPYPGDATDAYSLTTSQGSGYIDPVTGQMASFAPNGPGSRLYEFIYLLHTGQGTWPIGLLLGLSMLAVPFVIASGIAMTLRRPANPLRYVKNTPALAADTIVLVGSEGATTWGFAAELSRKLAAEGHSVHVTDMNSRADTYPNGKYLFVLTATYGKGEAPTNAQHFLERLNDFRPNGMRYCVLGFGDTSFPDFCKFAKNVDAALHQTGLQQFHSYATIDRQSSQSFHSWGRTVGQSLGLNLSLDHCAETPKTTHVQLVSKRSYGQEVQAPVAILRLGTKCARSLPKHSAGDLLGVIAPGASFPRYYSLASDSRDGCIEICVRKQPGGLCSGYLADIMVGDTVEVFIKPNPEFRPAKSNAPLILVGAGVGIGPLVGFLRCNLQKRPTHLFWGGRDPSSDYLFREELDVLKTGGQITQITTAFSRIAGGGYVQGKLQSASRDLQTLIQSGAQIMVCGGRVMGTDVQSAFNELLSPIGLDVATLKQQGRYLEDVY
ncbi:PepSY domain-containing protein [Parasedimentitalea marina]|nr:PepSY domain-containing protein [Parasedimentitalea marina]